ncbi:MAG: hypothetical protein GY716_12610 [bacterium]|nr:hypothetical protein [bacterium]
MKRHWFGLFLLAVCAAAAVASEEPAAVSDLARPMGDGYVEQWTAPAVDAERLLEQDRRNAGKRGIPLRVAHPMRQRLTPENNGTWDYLPSGDRVWRLRVHSAGALWLVLGFDGFRLEPGAELRVHDPERKTILGPYTSDDVRSHGELWVPPVHGETAVVELFWPATLAGVEPDLSLETVTHGYKATPSIDDVLDPVFDSAGDPGAGACNVDINCPLGADWQNEKRGVVLILLGGNGNLCSGSLINALDRDSPPLVLTADHCFIGGGTATGSIFFFHKERDVCGTGGTTSTQSQTGAVLRASNGLSDFVLMELDSSPPANFNLYFNGWSRSTAAPSEAWGIHHPQGDFMKISYDEGPVDDRGATQGLNYWGVEGWEDGTTEPGSSGSPLFDPDHRIIGALTGGVSSCANQQGEDEYGKFSRSWTGSGTPATSLMDWLDPEGHDVMTLDGRDQSEPACQTDSDCVGDPCLVCALSNATCQILDSDSDGLCDALDNCPLDANGGQENIDSDAHGDVCDNCPDDVNNGQADFDTDGTGDVCDNCPLDANGGQENMDSDAHGDVCDNCPDDVNDGQADFDTDGTGDVCDNCPATANGAQDDCDDDGTGDACESDLQRADADESGRVDGFDLNRLGVAMGASSPDPRYDATVDLDCDGSVGGDDLMGLAIQFGLSLP